MSQMTPKEIVHELDKHIIGQNDAKRAVAIALRNRWRRGQIEEPLKSEITPKNILMIGPTGVGKTEIARRLAKLANAPFIKVEATKFTEVGYVGRDVESIIRDLADVSIKMAREDAKAKVQERAIDLAEEKILDILLPPARSSEENDEWDSNSGSVYNQENSTRQKFRKMLREGSLDDKEIEVDIAQPSIGVEIMAPPGMEEMTNQLQGLFQNIGGNTKTKKRKMPIKKALKYMTDEEASKLINEEDTKLQAIENIEQNGIVFLDEIDKIANKNNHGGEVSREGVQRDLLPLVEGSTVSTKYGMIKTDHILFICSGAFHVSKPSDLIPELQGRLPIRVELQALKVEDFERILVEPDASLTEQYQALLATENVNVSYTDDGIKRIAEIAYTVNENTENIGARRLHTIMERLLEDLSFTAGSSSQLESVTIDTKYVDEYLSDLSTDQDLSRYIL